jgi:hypothetical protein
MPGQVNVKIAWTRPGGGAAPVITSPAFLVAGTVDTLYPTTTFTASGTAPITWSVTAGTLPAGMAFSSAGVLSGTPTATASGSITFTATNAYGPANTSLTLTVNAAGAGPTLVSPTTISAWNGTSILKVIPATWQDELVSSQYPIYRTYQWTKNGAPISGATAGIYTPLPSDDGNTIGVTETAGFLNATTPTTPPPVTATSSGTIVPTGSPSSALLVKKENVVYQGTFLLPRGTTGFAGGGNGLWFNANGTGSVNSFSVASGNNAGELNYPTLYEITNFVSNAELVNVPTASILQSATDPSEGAFSSSGVSGAGQRVINGVAAYASNLYFTYGDSYPTNTGYSVFYQRPFNLSSTGSVSGPFVVYDPLYQTETRWSAGGACSIPSTLVSGVNYQTALGGNMLFGKSFGSINPSLSTGPCAISVDMSTISTALSTKHTGTAQGGSSNTIQLAATANSTPGYYEGQFILAPSSSAYGIKITAYDGPSRTATIGQNWPIANPTSSSSYSTVPYVSGKQIVGYPPNDGTGTPMIDPWWITPYPKFPFLWGTKGNFTGMAIPNGTRSLLFVGRAGDGINSYGENGGIGTFGEKIYDPDDVAQGTHAYPYSVRVIAYDLADLAAVASNPSTNRMYNVKPYTAFQLNIPGEQSYSYTYIKAVAYNSAQRMLYVTVQIKDGNIGGGGYDAVLVHAYLINNAVAA